MQTAGHILAQGPTPSRASRAAAAKPKVGAISAGTRFVYLMWIFILFDPQWWAAKFVGTWVRSVPTALFAILLVMVFFRRPKFWFPPLAVFMLYTIFLIPFAYNRGHTFAVVKTLIGFYTLAVGTMAFVRNVKQAVPIVKAAFFWQFIWWVALGVYGGSVYWHPTLANFDGYGPLMVIGIGSTYFYALATRKRKERRRAFLVSLGCVVGLVSSFARGAVLGAVAVLFWIWFRSKRKGVTMLAMAAGAVAVAIAGSVIGGTDKRSETGNSFFVEMATIGSGDGTQSDRSVLWALARRVWWHNPIIGVGAENFGAYAAENFAAGTVGGAYDDNPAILWSRQLHSTYYEILCEYGTIGSAIFLWMLVDFFRRNAQLRQLAFRKRWASVSGGELDLGQLARAVETAMVGYLATGAFYNQIFDVHWVYTLVTINSVLHIVSMPQKKAVFREPAAQPA